MHSSRKSAMVPYSQPATPQYQPQPQPTRQSHKQRGYRLCDQCNKVESPDGARFRLCGGCMTTQYCSVGCQQQHWKSHKVICRHTAAQMNVAKQQPMTVDDNLVRHLRKFTTAHQNLLNWLVFQALQLKRIPSNVRQKALLIELDYIQGTEPLRRFNLKATHIVPRTYVTDSDSLVADEIQRRDDRCRRAGGIGAAVVLIQCCGISQVMPVEVDPPHKISWDSRDDWANVAREFFNSGRTDFAPISTTSRGIVYG